MKLPGIKTNFTSANKVAEPKVPIDYGPIKIVGRVLVILVILYLAVLSVLYLTDARGRETRSKTEQIDAFFKEPEKYLDQQGYYSFAGSFLRDYLTKDGLERSLKNYSTREMPIAWASDLKGQRVEETYPVSITRINDNQAVVRIGAFVSSIFSAKNSGEADQLKQKIMYFDLAVYGFEGEYVITQLPQVVAALPKAEEDYRVSTLSEANSETAALVMADVESFMRAYLEGTENDIAFFTDLKLIGLKGSVKYSGIERSQVFLIPEDRNRALVKIDVLTESEGLAMQQHYELSLEKKEKWKVLNLGVSCPEFEKYIKANEEENK